MPIEFERKLLLRTANSTSLIADLQQQAEVEWFDIVQAYINNSCRIRHVVPHNLIAEKEKFVFTFKTKVRGSTVEIEQDISVHDYQKLFLISKPVVVKTRAKIVCGSHTWDIDFLRKPKSGEIYLALAEVEMPEFERQLPSVHPYLEPYAVKWITHGDKRFNNRNLANPKKTAKAVSDLENETETTS